MVDLIACEGWFRRHYRRAGLLASAAIALGAVAQAKLSGPASGVVWVGELAVDGNGALGERDTPEPRAPERAIVWFGELAPLERKKPDSRPDLRAQAGGPTRAIVQLPARAKGDDRLTGGQALEARAIAAMPSLKGGADDAPRPGLEPVGLGAKGAEIDAPRSAFPVSGRLESRHPIPVPMLKSGGDRAIARLEPRREPDEMERSVVRVEGLREPARAALSAGDRDLRRKSVGRPASDRGSRIRGANAQEPKEYASLEPLSANELGELRGGLRAGGVEFAFAVVPELGAGGVTRPVSVFFGNLRADVAPSGEHFNVNFGHSDGQFVSSLTVGSSLPLGRIGNGQLAVVVRNFGKFVGTTASPNLRGMLRDPAVVGVGR